MKKTISAFLTCCMLPLGACAVGPDFKEPDSHAPRSYTAPEDAPMPADQHLLSGRALDGNWWDQLGSPALDDLVKLALSSNQSIQAAKARVAEVDEQVAAAKGALLPQASLAAQNGRQKYGATMFGPLNINVPPYTYYSAGANLSIPLDLFGGGRRTVEENQARAEYQRDELDAAYLSLTGNIVMQALVAASGQAQVAAMNRVIASDQKIVELQRMAVDQGAAPDARLLEAENQLAMDKAQLPVIAKRITEARHALAILVGKAPADWSPPSFSLDDFTLPRDIPAALPSELVHRRPDILAAEAQLHAASAAIGIATANLYPRIDLSAAYAFQSLTPGALFNGSGAAWSLAASLIQPLYDGGQLSAQRRASIDAYRAALADYRQVLLTSFGDVADRLQALSEDGDQLGAQNAVLQSATSSLKLARTGHAEGYTNMLDLLARERLAALAEIAVTEARAQRFADTASLFLSLGGSHMAPEIAAQEADNTVPEN